MVLSLQIPRILSARGIGIGKYHQMFGVNLQLTLWIKSTTVNWGSREACAADLLADGIALHVSLSCGRMAYNNQY